uniref:Uncharacterized protein n=1 Tax=Lactuca sativa TaxID=4236 RepID=A0A9R1XSS7_LACSA|nr:hypothetical protein LSAT_V11C300151210 [Lactuca sativa]
MNKARNKAYWNNYVSKKKQQNFSSKKSESVNRISQKPSFGDKRSMSKSSQSQKYFSKNKEHVSKTNRKFNVQTSYHDNYVKNQQSKSLVKNSKNQRFSQNNYQRNDYRSNEQKSYHRVPSQHKFLDSQTLFSRNNVHYQNRFMNRYTPHVSIRKPTRNFENLKVQGRRNESYEPDQPRKGKRFQYGKFSQEQIKDAYEKYLYVSSNQSSSLKEANPSKETKKNEDKVNVDFKSSNDYISIPLNNDVDLIDSDNTCDNP